VDVPPELVGHPRYQVLERLGSGNMGAVFKARHQVMERTVALKVIHPSLTEDADATARFQREVKAAARLTHPNIVTAYDAEETGKTHYLVMEFVPGTSLDRIVATRGPLPVDEACDYIRQAALGLQHAHECGMIHRDVKPQNLMRTATGQIKILDFGLARFARGDGSGVSLTQSNIAMGTPDYIAPEQALNARRVDIRADIYSLGCTLYQLLSGQVPFPVGTVFEKLLAHTEATPKALSSLRADVPAELERIVARMMAKEPGERYQTPAEVAEVLAPFAEPARDRAPTLASVGEAGPAVLPGPATYRESPPVRPAPANARTAPPPRSRRPLVLLAALALVVVAGLLVAGFSLWQRSRSGSDGGPADPVGQQNAATPAPAGEIRRLEGHTGFAPCVVFLPSGRQALSGSRDRTIRLWDVDTGQELARLESHRMPISGLAVSADGRRLLSSAVGAVQRNGERVGVGGVRLWDLDTRKLLPFNPGLRGPVPCVALSSNGQRALIAGNDQHVYLYDLETGARVRTLTGHEGHIWSVTFLPAGDQALTASADRTIRLWDLGTGAERRRFRGHTDAVRCLALSPDGRRFLSGAADRSVRFWSLDGDKPLLTLTGHDRPVTTVAFLPDGRHAVSGSADQTVRLWDLLSGQQEYEIHGLGYAIEQVAISPDGRQILIAGRNAILRVWRLPAGGRI
jgi:tRNA A-37 threonylcarbamoyl transferase component Bud32